MTYLSAQDLNRGFSVKQEAQGEFVKFLEYEARENPQVKKLLEERGRSGDFKTFKGDDLKTIFNAIDSDSAKEIFKKAIQDGSFDVKEAAQIRLESLSFMDHMQIRTGAVVNGIWSYPEKIATGLEELSGLYADSRESLRDMSKEVLKSFGLKEQDAEALSPIVAALAEEKVKGDIVSNPLAGWALMGAIMFGVANMWSNLSKPVWGDGNSITDIKNNYEAAGEGVVDLSLEVVPVLGELSQGKHVVKVPASVSRVTLAFEALKDTRFGKYMTEALEAGSDMTTASAKFAKSHIDDILEVFRPADEFATAGAYNHHSIGTSADTWSAIPHTPHSGTGTRGVSKLEKLYQSLRASYQELSDALLRVKADFSDRSAVKSLQKNIEFLLEHENDLNGKAYSLTKFEAEIDGRLGEAYAYNKILENSDVVMDLVKAPRTNLNSGERLSLIKFAFWYKRWEKGFRTTGLRDIFLEVNKLLQETRPRSFSQASTEGRSLEQLRGEIRFFREMQEGLFELEKENSKVFRQLALGEDLSVLSKKITEWRSAAERLDRMQDLSSEFVKLFSNTYNAGKKPNLTQWKRMKELVTELNDLALKSWGSLDDVLAKQMSSKQIEWFDWVLRQ